MDHTGIQHLQLPACGFRWISYVKGTRRRRRQHHHHYTVNILIHLDERGKWKPLSRHPSRWPHAHGASDKGRNLKWTNKKQKKVSLPASALPIAASHGREKVKKVRESEMGTASVWMSQSQSKKRFYARRSIVLPGRGKKFFVLIIFFYLQFPGFWWSQTSLQAAQNLLVSCTKRDNGCLTTA